MWVGSGSLCSDFASNKFCKHAVCVSPISTLGTSRECGLHSARRVVLVGTGVPLRRGVYGWCFDWLSQARFMLYVKPVTCSAHYIYTNDKNVAIFSNSGAVYRSICMLLNGASD